MANATQQIHGESGQDSAISSRQATHNTSGQKSIGGTERQQVTMQDGSTTVQDRPAIISTTTQDAAASVNLTNEDFAFTLGFSVLIKQRRPCKRIPTD